MKSRFYYGLGLVLALALARPAGGGPNTGGPNTGGEDPVQTRFARLARGINVSWVNNARFELNAERAREDARLIKATGCNHVRLVINVDSLRDPADPGRPAEAKLPTLDAAVAIALGEDLAVIIDAFHYDKTGLIKFPGPDDPAAKAMERFWGALARHLAPSDPERVFLEVANEPALENPQDWYAIQARLLEAMRQAAPRHTLIAGYNLRSSKNEWNSIKALTLIPVTADRNVIYNFHFYDPMVVTHQGASWSWKFGQLRDIPYPSTPERIAPLLERFPDRELRWNLEKYGRERWGSEKIDGLMATVEAWAREKGVRVTCNEFGVYYKVAPPEARVAWTRDVRRALEKHGIGWTIWEGSFGFMRHEGGRVVMDEPILEALGLKKP